MQKDGLDWVGRPSRDEGMVMYVLKGDQQREYWERIKEERKEKKRDVRACEILGIDDGGGVEKEKAEEGGGEQHVRFD